MLEPVPFLIDQDESQSSEDGENKDDGDDHEVKNLLITRFFKVQNENKKQKENI